MVSSTAITAAQGFQPKEKPRLIDDIAEKSQPERDDPAKPSKAHDAPLGRPRRAGTPHAPRGPPDDDLDERIGPKLIFSISDLARLADRSPATIFRLLRLAQLDCVQVSGSRCFTRAIVLDFLRNGSRRSAA
jgi:hypothetical protein